MNHLLAPWVVGVTVDYTYEKPWPVFRLRDLTNTDPDGDEVQAKRRLIEASPDLLAACKLAVKTVALEDQQVIKDAITKATKP